MTGRSNHQPGQAANENKLILRCALQIFRPLAFTRAPSISLAPPMITREQREPSVSISPLRPVLNPSINRRALDHDVRAGR